MELFVGILLVVIGVIMLIMPRIMWKMADSWKTKSNAGPTRFYMNFIRIGGLILVIGGIFAALQR